jgi:hypothetical protein
MSYLKGFDKRNRIRLLKLGTLAHSSLFARVISNNEKSFITLTPNLSGDLLKKETFF